MQILTTRAKASAGQTVVVVTLQANVVGHVVVEATSLTGASRTTPGRITTATTTDLTSTMADPTMEPPVAKGTMALAETAPAYLFHLWFDWVSSQAVP